MSQTEPSQVPPWVRDIMDRVNAEAVSGGKSMPANDPQSASDNVSAILENMRLADAINPSSQPMIDSYDALLQAQPEEAFERWTSLYRARTRCGTNPDLEACTHAFSDLFPSADTDSAKALIVDKLVRVGICTLYREIVSESDFFRENPSFIYNVLGIFDGLVFLAALNLRSGRGKKLFSEMKKIASPLWKTSWTHHDFFLDTHPYEQCSPIPAHSFRIQLRHTLLGYHPAMRSDEDRLLDGYMDLRRLTLLVWFHGHEDSDLDEDAERQTEYLFPAIHTAFQIRDGRSDNELADDLFAYVSQDITAVYGAEAYLERLCYTFEEPHFVDEVLYTFFMFSGRVLMHPDFLPYYASSGILDALTEALERQATTGQPSAQLQWKFLEEILPLFNWISERLPLSEGAGHLIKSCDFIEVLARSVLASARATSDDGSTCANILKTYRTIAGEVNARSTKNPLRKVLRQSLRYEWYRTLKVLRAFPASGERAKRKHVKLLSSWKGLGEEIGLEEEAERAEYEREMKKAAQFCSWKECQYHTEKSDSPMKTCVGCEEARYCGRSCQQRDWRDGKHKARCKRIKDAPNP